MSNAFDAKWDSENDRWLRYRWSRPQNAYYREQGRGMNFFRFQALSCLPRAEHSTEGQQWTFLDWHVPGAPIYTHYHDPEDPDSQFAIVIR